MGGQWSVPSAMPRADDARRTGRATSGRYDPAAMPLPPVAPPVDGVPGSGSDYPGGGGWAALEADAAAVPPSVPARSRLPVWTVLRVGVVLVAAGSVLVGYVTSADRDADGAIVGAGALDPAGLVVGDCFDDGDEEVVDGLAIVATIAAVPCAEPHDNEVFHAFTLPGAPGATQPSADVTGRMAGEGCYAAFEPFVGRPYEDSALDFTVMTPGEEAWRLGDRRAMCVLHDVSGAPLLGSARGSAR